MLKLVCDKYVLELNWRLELSPEVTIREPLGGVEGAEAGGVISPAGRGGPFLAFLAFLESILTAIELQLEVGVTFMLCAVGGGVCCVLLMHAVLLIQSQSLSERNPLKWTPLVSHTCMSCHSLGQ